MLTGRYTTKRGGGITYVWEASCGMHGEDWHWQATVRFEDGRPAGKPNGIIYKAPSLVEDPVLTMFVQNAIEHRVGVD